MITALAVTCKDSRGKLSQAEGDFQADACLILKALLLQHLLSLWGN